MQRRTLGPEDQPTATYLAGALKEEDVVAQLLLRIPRGSDDASNTHRGGALKRGVAGIEALCTITPN